MTISSQGVTSFNLRQNRRFEGMPSRLPKPRGIAYANPYRRQSDRLTFGGTETDGDYSVALAADGYSETITITRAAGVPATNADLAAAFLAEAAGAKFKGVIKSAVVGANPEDVDITFMRPGLGYTLTPVAPGAGTLTRTPITSSAGVEIPVGRFVTVGMLEGVDSMILPGPSTVAADIRGAVARPLTELTNPRDRNAGGDLVYRPGKMASVNYEITFAMMNRGSITTSLGGPVHVVRNIAGGDPAGSVRADNDGGNTIVLDATRVQWIQRVAPGELGDIKVNL